MKTEVFSSVYVSVLIRFFYTKNHSEYSAEYFRTFYENNLHEEPS